MSKNLLHFLSRPQNLARTNAILLLVAILANAYFQAFCRPTTWATVVLVICFANTVFYPLLKPGTFIFYCSNFISGVSFGVFLYCITF
jgi:hypothetical protein